ncbi:HBL/NHE enterotoxin family protein [Bacillus sp. SRB3LM]|uniref:HBL/NHE enterotoxin family protein n=1 Tax=Bacillus sp. SRB3LM TaxID=2608689 RepID=UPI0018C444D9|nr:HBL/NHE enterotoxin family protein [Bacillus sp. SRB3LM]MBG0969263.1 HBL/NHE enterotoxin family protein [Bacillus sp. SRB3LM]MBG0971068.1 HBL/NHE enterotoxin family protein [Bacillus sp. SRB3LM]
MRKYPYKILAIASVLTMVNVNLIPPIQALTQNQAIRTQYQKSQLNPPKVELQQQLMSMNNYYVAMQVYSQMITGQADINLESVDLDSKNSTLKKELSAHQEAARENAKYWDGDLRKKIIGVNQGIISYDNQFQQYSKSLETAIAEEDKEAIKTMITKRLMKNAKEQQETVNDLINNFEKFDDKLMNDNQAFEEDGRRLVSILAGEDSLIDELEKQILIYNTTIDQNLKYLVGGALAMGVGLGAGGLAIGLIAFSGGILIPVILGVGALAIIAGGGYEAYTNYDSMNNAKEGLENATQQLSTARSALITLTEAQSAVGNLHKTIREARNTLGHISTQWGITYAKYNTLLKDIDEMSPEELEFIKDDLEVGKNSWADLRKWAEEIQKQISAVTIPTTSQSAARIPYDGR